MIFSIAVTTNGRIIKKVKKKKSDTVRKQDVHLKPNKLNFWEKSFQKNNSKMHSVLRSTLLHPNTIVRHEDQFKWNKRISVYGTRNKLRSIIFVYYLNYSYEIWRDFFCCYWVFRGAGLPLSTWQNAMQWNLKTTGFALEKEDHYKSPTTAPKLKIR